MFDLEKVRRRTGIACLDFHESIPSTNDRAKNLARQNLADRRRDVFPMLVLTDEQTAGRGQQTRRWWSGTGSLTFSWVFFVPALESGIPFPTNVTTALAPIIAGVAAAKAIETQTGLDPVEIKWPNDLIVGGRKIAGILVETVTSIFGSACIVGIGVNANNSELIERQVESLGDRKFDNVPTNRLPPTSIQVETDRPIPLTELLIGIIQQLQTCFAQAPKTSIADANRRLAYRGQVIRVIRPDHSPLSGVCHRISDKGGLVINSVNSTETIFSGSVDLPQKA